VNDHAQVYTVTEVSLVHVICCFCKKVSCIIDIPNKNHINIIYQLIPCITVSANLKFCTETDTYTIYPHLGYVPGNVSNCCLL
jgi:hypothetical protein